LNRGIPFFEKYATKPENNQQTMQDDFLNKRKEGLEKYLNSILGNTLYYDPILYRFIGYDIINRRPLINSGSTTPRESFMDNGSYSLRGRFDSKNPLGEAQLEAKGVWAKINYTGAFKIEINLRNSTMKIPTFKNVRISHATKVSAVYELILEERDTVDRSRILRQIIQFRKFKEFVQLQQNMVKYYEGRSVNVPKAPEKVGLMGGKNRPEERKSGLQQFTNAVLRLPNASECECFREFFYLNDIRSDTKEPVDVEVYDFRDEFKYDDIVEGEGPSVVSEFIKKFDILGISNK